MRFLNERLSLLAPSFLQHSAAHPYFSLHSHSRMHKPNRGNWEPKSLSEPRAQAELSELRHWTERLRIPHGSRPRRFPSFCSGSRLKDKHPLKKPRSASCTTSTEFISALPASTLTRKGLSRPNCGVTCPRSWMTISRSSLIRRITGAMHTYFKLIRWARNETR